MCLKSMHNRSVGSEDVQSLLWNPVLYRWTIIYRNFLHQKLIWINIKVRLQTEAWTRATQILSIGFLYIYFTFLSLFFLNLLHEIHSLNTLPQNGKLRD